MMNCIIQYYFLLLSLLLSIVKAGHINSWDITTLCNFDGKPISYNLIFKLESGLGP